MTQKAKDSLAEGLRQGLLDGVTKSEEIKDNTVLKTLKYIEEKTQNPEAKTKLKQLREMSDREIKLLVDRAKEYLNNKNKQVPKFKPIFGNVKQYTDFLQNVTCHYNLIIK